MDTNNLIEIDELILSYYNKTSSKEEDAALLQWVAERLENKEYFKSELLLLKKPEIDTAHFDAKDAYADFQKRLPATKEVSFYHHKWWLMVASVVALIIAGGAFFMLNRQDEAKMLTYTYNPKLPQVVLSDKTEVTLSKSAKLIAPNTFEQKKRRVELDGQAFFNVHHNKHWPFIIKTGNILTEVVGTSFNINYDKAQGLFTISVESGVVKVSDCKHTFNKVLYKGDQLVVNEKTKEQTAQKIKNNNYLAWKTNVLTYKNTPIKEVMSDLESLYGKHMVLCDSSLPEIKVTIQIDHQTLPEVQVLLEKLLGVKARETQDTIYFYAQTN
ncbi:MAG: FecR domain-containing protein [Paludibacteraceae bacterium]|nr:FecR domain-containing protein [Paludibacteraceae bacterium]